MAPKSRSSNRRLSCASSTALRLTSGAARVDSTAVIIPVSFLASSAASRLSASFFRSDLSESNLKNVRGFRAKFVNATIRDAVLDGAGLSEADLTKSDLSESSLVGVDLRRARLFRTVLRGADLTGARMGGADLTKADLSGATWTDGERVCAEGSIGRCN